ncbi:MAG: GNAT family N-acetyltransferase [Alphaproteobacteria bacterium]|nr:GNAT family N-acetyltransferase [Alphaproteobacteria bacterium]
MTSQSAYSIRAARPADSASVAALLAASYAELLAGHYDGDILRRALPYLSRANPTLLLSGTYHVAECEPGNLIGCGGWTVAAPGSGEIIEGQAHIRHFAIAPTWVRRGIGAALLARCLSDARQAGVRKLLCLSTLNAEPFYRAFGFDAVAPVDVPMGPDLRFPGVLMSCGLVSS